MGLVEKKTQAQQAGVTIRRMKRGELIFAEGEHSRAMYLIRSGMIRLYKKKGESQIELDTVRAGQILGELAFLDGNPRSASGECLTDCEMIEISGVTFTNVLRGMPDWLKIMLKTIVGRLRTASTRIRQLESSSTAFDYSARDGRRTSHYVYLSHIDVMKVFTAILTVGGYYSDESSGSGIKLRAGLLQRYANQIMGVPVAKITTLMDVLSQVAVIEIGSGNSEYILKDIDFLEQLIGYINSENLLEPSKRHDISLRGFLVLSMLAKYVKNFPQDSETGSTSMNIIEIIQTEATVSGREPFRVEDFAEVEKMGYATQLNYKTEDEAFTTVKQEELIRAYRFQRVMKAVEAMNEEKRKRTK